MPFKFVPDEYPCPRCGPFHTLVYENSSDLYHRYKCNRCGLKLLVPKGGKS